MFQMVDIEKKYTVALGPWYFIFLFVLFRGHEIKRINKYKLMFLD